MTATMIDRMNDAKLLSSRANVKLSSNETHWNVNVTELRYQLRVSRQALLKSIKTAASRYAQQRLSEKSQSVNFTLLFSGNFSTPI